MVSVQRPHAELRNALSDERYISLIARWLSFPTVPINRGILRNYYHTENRVTNKQLLATMRLTTISRLRVRLQYFNR
jgi:hypothetical protein